jgi:hypothetical protein
MPKDQMRSFCLARSFVASLKGSQKQKKYESNARYLQYNKQGFYKQIDEAVAQVLSFLTGFPSEHFRNGDIKGPWTSVNVDNNLVKTCMAYLLRVWHVLAKHLHVFVWWGGHGNLKCGAVLDVWVVVYRPFDWSVCNNSVSFILMTIIQIEEFSNPRTQNVSHNVPHPIGSDDSIHPYGG